jgi:release factor glutamine methyltransferase
MKFADVISNGAAVLKDAGIPDPRREASSLLSFATGQNAAYLIAHSDDHLAAQYKMMFEACIRRRAKHEPFQYITGKQEFYGLHFTVTPDVLIPRPETEILVEKAIKLLSAGSSQRFCEVGIGSGCMSVAMLHEVETSNALGIDISAAALAIAGRNAETNDVAHRLTLRQGDVLGTVAGTFDMIVSNPPYVPTSQLAKLQAEVREYEPRMALAGGEDGLDIIERIVAQAPGHLKPGGHLLLEMGYDQAERVRALFDRSVWHDPSVIDDLQHIPRIVLAKLR